MVSVFGDTKAMDHSDQVCLLHWMRDRDGSNMPIWNRKNPDTGGFYVMRSKVGANPGQELTLTIGMRLREEIDANIDILAGDVTYRAEDRALLAQFCAHAYDSNAIKAMKVD